VSELDVVCKAFSNVLDELIDGAAADAGWVLNPGDAGIFGSLEKLSAEHASAVPPGGGASVAAHVDHLRYGLHLLNRWSQGEDPFKDADYSASWRRITVSKDEWTSRREQLRREAYAWRAALQHPPGATDIDLTIIVASIAHFAYHLGAIRQIDRSSRGPSARD
jgi:hypothetical protein